jgi:hypothetical protein
MPVPIIFTLSVLKLQRLAYTPIVVQSRKVIKNCEFDEVELEDIEADLGVNR